MLCARIYSEWHNETPTHPTIYETKYKCQPNSRANKLIHEPTHERISLAFLRWVCVCVPSLHATKHTNKCQNIINIPEDSQYTTGGLLYFSWTFKCCRAWFRFVTFIQFYHLDRTTADISIKPLQSRDCLHHILDFLLRANETVAYGYSVRRMWMGKDQGEEHYCSPSTTTGTCEIRP